jgi:2-methylcitrate dehydratase
VEIRPDAEFSARYPQQLNARITLHTKDGHELKQEKLGYEGSLANPMPWERVVEKFHWLSEAHADAGLRRRIIEGVQSLDERPISDLMSLLAAVKPVVTYATVHPGIQ